MSHLFWTASQLPSKSLLALCSCIHLVITSFLHIPVLTISHTRTKTYKCSFIFGDSGNVNTKWKTSCGIFHPISIRSAKKRFLPWREEGVRGLIDQRQANLLCPVSGSVKHRALRGFIREEMPSDPMLTAGPETGKGHWGHNRDSFTPHRTAPQEGEVGSCWGRWVAKQPLYEKPESRQRYHSWYHVCQESRHSSMWLGELDLP